MRPLVILGIVSTLISSSVLARSRAVIPSPIDFSRVLWIGAHPDDESLVSPLLGYACAERGLQCKVIVATRGENGACALPAGCGDMATTRSGEVAAAGALLHAGVEQWQLPDVLDPELQWDAAAGGHEALLERMRNAIRAFRPTAIMTFDPAHGTTCHPAHRYVAQLAIEASESDATPVYLLETRAQLDGGGYVLSSGVADALPVLVFDGTRTWGFLLADMRAHASQFSVGVVDSLEDAADKRVRFIRAADRDAIERLGAPCE